jgi:hypothetical protein
MREKRSKGSLFDRRTFGAAASARRVIYARRAAHQAAQQHLISSPLVRW